MVTNGFTQDVITLFQAAPIGGMLARHALGLLKQEGESDCAETMRQAVIAALAPSMNAAHPLVAQIMARALLEHVDWSQVVASVATDETLN